MNLRYNWNARKEGMTNKNLTQKIVLANILLLIIGAIIRNVESDFQAIDLTGLFILWLGTVWLHVNSRLRPSEIKP